MLEETDLLRTPDLDAYGKAMNLTAETPNTGTGLRYIGAAMCLSSKGRVLINPVLLLK